jgi:peptidoglycan/xylan/chitin deacetylase (PgdA/CDA1 family)
VTKSAALGALLRRMGICGLILHARRRGWMRRDALTILGYHRIAPPPTDGFSGEDDNLSAAPAAFEREIGLLRRYFTPLTFAGLLAARNGGSLLPNPLIVTFDDGYRDNAEVAAPLLRQYGVPACFFLTTGFLNGEALPWWDAINRAFRLAPPERVRLETLEGMEFDLSAPGSRPRAAAAVRRRFRTLPATRYRAVLDELGEAAGCDLQASVFQGSFMSWEQAARLVQQGFEIGGHTRTHPVLAQLTCPEELDHEIGGARRELEDRLRTRVIAFAYPVGGKSAVSEAAIAAARRAGYEFACTYQDGLNSLGRLDGFALRRISVGAGATFGQFCAKMALPGLFRRGNF